MRRRIFKSVVPLLVGSVLLSVGARAETPSLARELGSESAPRVPTLSAVLELAAKRAPDVLVGEAGVSTAQSNLVGAGRPPVGNPYLEVTGDRAWGAGMRRTALIGTLWIPVEIAGQRSTRMEEANAGIAFYREHLQLARALATGDAMRAYGMAVVTRDRAQLLQQLVDVSQSEVQFYEARFQTGDATLRDTRLAAVELGRYRVLLDETRADIAAALTELGRLTGATFAEPPEGSLHPPVLPVGANDAERAPGVRVSRAEAMYFERSRARWQREGNAGALSAMAIGGRGELGDARVGAGIAYAFPVLQRNQGEQARAEAERARAVAEEKLKLRVFRGRLAGLVAELEQVRVASERLEKEAEPAAVATLDASLEMQRAGKTDLFTVLTSRRDLALLRLRRIELATREWSISSELVSITGTTP